ncbi:hypothetical protein [Aquabacter cavernae]|uniref:hypothetical protein n=1 Tax=Aquabacter cavernae TaxID=2496029 RepID=UPI000F8CB8F8|nr:hypothetical protein [Aquabacter cavernae]
MLFSPSEPESQEPLTPEQERVLRKVRRFSSVSILVMVLGVMCVLGVIAYRMLTSKNPSPGEITATLPKDSRIVSTAVSDGLLVLTLDVGGLVEVRTYHLTTLAPAGRMRFAAEP